VVPFNDPLDPRTLCSVGNWTLIIFAVVLTREESRGVDVLKRHVVSRPIPLEYLKVAQSHGAPQTRRERSEHGSSAKGLLSLSGIRGEARPAYPLTFWHAGDKNNRRYTMYATSEGVRRKWENAIVDAISVRRAHQEANMVRGVLLDCFVEKC
jgi:hypothetical protein